MSETTAARPAHPALGRRGAAWAALLAALMGLATPTAAQESGGPSWPPVAAGLRFGYDQSASGEVVGAQLRVPVLRSGRVELVPNADVTFLSRLREYGANVDAVYVTGGRGGGLYLGGGLALRNSIFGVDEAAARESKVGYGLVLGAKAGGPARFGTQIEFRWVFLPGQSYDPRAITIGVNFPLWRAEDRP